MNSGTNILKTEIKERYSTLDKKNPLPNIPVLTFWTCLLILTYTGQGFSSLGMLVLTVLPIVFMLYMLFEGPTKRSSVFGKILIFGGVLSLITLLVHNGKYIANLETLVSTSAALTGLYIERVSPHRKLRDFMFLAISTKLEFIGITVLVAILQSQQPVTQFEPTYWYLVAVLMALSIPFLALEKIQAYRSAVWVTTLVSLTLILDLVISSNNASAVCLGILLILWPAVAARAIGRKVFFLKQRR